MTNGKGWTGIYPFSSGGLGITAFQRFSSVGAVERTNEDMVGVIAVDYRFDGISSILEDATSTFDNEDVIVYIAETNSAAKGYLIGTSLGSLDYLTSVANARVLAVDCNHTVVKSAARFLEAQRATGASVNDQLYINEQHHFIMSSPVGAAEGIEWEMVMIQKVQCLPGYFEDIANAMCSRCVTPSTSKAGSLTCDQCIEGFYWDSEITACETCPHGANCPGGDSGLILERGFCSSGSASNDVWPCPLGFAACPGDRSTSENQCASGYSGVLCAVCQPGYVQTGDYCADCSALDTPIVTIIFVVTTTVVLLVTWRLARINKRVAAATEALSFSVPLKIYFATCQILGTCE